MLQDGSWRSTGEKEFHGRELTPQDGITSISDWHRRKKQKASVRKHYSASLNGFVRVQKAVRRNQRRVYRTMRRCLERMAKRWRRSWSSSFRTVRVLVTK